MTHEAIKRFGVDFYARVEKEKRGWVAHVRSFKLYGHASEADAWATIRQYAVELLDAAHEAETAVSTTTTEAKED